jgi:hypothetical protein
MQLKAAWHFSGTFAALYIGTYGNVPHEVLKAQ